MNTSHAFSRACLKYYLQVRATKWSKKEWEGDKGEGKKQQFKLSRPGLECPLSRQECPFRRKSWKIDAPRVRARNRMREARATLKFEARSDEKQISRMGRYVSAGNSIDLAAITVTLRRLKHYTLGTVINLWVFNYERE